MAKGRSLLVLLFVMAPGLTIPAQHSQSPYAGQESRAIKALSDEEVEQYLAGQGMGFAKAAELNQYPGPKHVLELAAKLGLTEEQEARISQAREAMRTEAMQLGELIVARERELDSLFAGGEISRPQLEALVSEIARLQGELRVVHLRAHLQTKQVLTVHQTHLYDQLRGYTSPGSHRHQEKH